jgi:hypothetical protein
MKHFMGVIGVLLAMWGLGSGYNAITDPKHLGLQGLLFGLACLIGALAIYWRWFRSPSSRSDVREPWPMVGAFKTFREAKRAQRDLREAFKARGWNFMTIDSTVHEALIKEAMFTGVQTTMEHFVRIEMHSFGRANEIIGYYKERSKKFNPSPS